MTNKEALEYAKGHLNHCVFTENEKKFYEMAISALEKQKQGQWVYNGYDEVIGEFMYECSCCGGISDGMYFYCKDCGAEMDCIKELKEEVDENE